MIRLTTLSECDGSDEFSTMPEFKTVCRIDDIPEGESRLFVVENTLVGVFHVDGEFYALHNECPHAGASLAHGLIEGNTVRCRIHHWRFCIKDGAYLDQDQPELNAKTIPVRVKDREVQVDVEPFPRSEGE